MTGEQLPAELPKELVPVHLPKELLAEVDRLVATGAYSTRAEVLGAAVELLAPPSSSDEIGARIVAGYKKYPPSPLQEQAAIASLREAILEEPW